MQKTNMQQKGVFTPYASQICTLKWAAEFVCVPMNEMMLCNFVQNVQMTSLECNLIALFMAFIMWFLYQGENKKPSSSDGVDVYRVRTHRVQDNFCSVHN